MKDTTRQAVLAVLIAAYLLLCGAFAPVQGRAAWWCTAFSVTCEESAAEGEGASPEFRLRLLDWLRGG